MLGLVSVLVAVTAACGGKVEEGHSQTLDDPRPNEGLTDPSNPADAPREGSMTCSPPDVITHACVPSAMRAGVPLRVHVEAAQSCNGPNVKCKVTVVGSTITVVPDVGEGCIPADPNAPASGEATGACTRFQATCEIPALAAGTYDLAGRGAYGVTALNRKLVIRDEAIAVACLDRYGAEMGK